MRHLIQPEAAPPYHWHLVLEETFTVTQGRFEFTLEGEKHLLGPGDTLTARPRMCHSFRALEPDSGLEQTVRPAGLHQQMFEETFLLAQRAGSPGSGCRGA